MTSDVIDLARDAAPVVLGRFDSTDAAERAVNLLLDAGIPWACIEGPTPRTAAVALKVAGRSDRYFAIETLRELGARVQVVAPVTPA